MESIKCEGFDFFNKFDSANLAKVENVPLDECCKFSSCITLGIILFVN